MRDHIIDAINQENVDVNELIQQSGFSADSVNIESLLESRKTATEDILDRILGKKDQFKDLVMVIDDDHSQLKSIRKLLGDSYYLLLCDRGQSAIANLKEVSDTVQSILLDIRLPDMSGFEVYEKIKAINYDIPIILITGYQQTYGDGFELYKKYRPHGYIVKNHENESQMILDTLASSVALYKHVQSAVQQKEALIRKHAMAGLLHDLRNMFVPISMIPRILNDTIKNDNPQQLHYFVDMLDKCVELYKENQQTIFNFVKGEKFLLDLIPVNLALVFPTFIDLCTFNNDVECKFTLNIDVYKDFFVDKNVLFYQVLYNIIRNSFDNFLALNISGLIEIRVCTYLQYLKDDTEQTLILNRDDDDLIIVISDNGGGIPPENEARFFEAYFTHGKLSGTGLGTWMVKMGVIDLLRGDIVLDNRPGAGLVYHLCIPHNLVDLISD